MECHEMMKTKAMNINFHPGRDDFIDRLFSFLTSTLPLEILQLKQIRNNVFLLETNNNLFILKGYQNLPKLRVQQDLTASLKRAGFNETYEFYQFTDTPLFFENRYYGCIGYIAQNRNHFTYQSQVEREEGLHLLTTFHSTTKRLVPIYKGVIPKQNLLKKWRDRLQRFKINRAIVNYYVPKQMTTELLEWAEVALAGMEKHKVDFESRAPVILHGDVAHHNFIRSKSSDLYLIDFDLVSIGPASYDLLQYSNRILPFMNWSLESLSKMEGLADHLHDNAFLYGLMYPSDIFREWNRIIKLNSYYNPARVAPLVELTVSQFNDRKDFIESLENKITS
ncbi:MAG: phosphotransferase [Bacillota bacterium]